MPAGRHVRTARQASANHACGTLVRLTALVRRPRIWLPRAAIATLVRHGCECSCARPRLRACARLP
eukprot:1097308-Alexandrium_andersonii.AAC.1